MSLVVAKKFATKGEDSAIEAWKRWPEWQPHWPRIRRRICDQCGRRVALSKPRYLVCGGCGAARYCSEACQIANWGHHQTVCAALARHAAREGKAARLRPLTLSEQYEAALQVGQHNAKK